MRATNGFIRQGSSTNQTTAKVLGGDYRPTKTGTNVLTLTANNTFTGAIKVKTGTLQLGDGITTGNIVPTGASIDVSAGATCNYFSATNGLTHAGTLTGAGAFIVTTTAPNTLFVTGNWSAFTGTMLAGRLIFQFVNGSSATTAYTVNSPGNIAGNNALTYDIGSLSGSGAMLSVGAGTVAWSIGALNTSTTFSGNFGVAATSNSFTKVGTGIFSLTGASLMNGSITISNGTVRLARLNGNTVPTGTPISIASGAFLDFANTIGSVTHSGTISGAGLVRRANAGGTTILTGNNSWSGGTNVNAGTLTISSLNGLGGGGAVAVNNGGTLTFTVNTTTTRTITVNTGGILNKGGFPLTNTTIVNLGGTVNP